MRGVRTAQEERKEEELSLLEAARTYSGAAGFDVCGAGLPPQKTRREGWRLLERAGGRPITQFIEHIRTKYEINKYVTPDRIDRS
jgi:hypothetical protein